MNWLELIAELNAQNPQALREPVVIMLADGSEVPVVLAQDQDQARDRVVLREVP